MTTVHPWEARLSIKGTLAMRHQALLEGATGTTSFPAFHHLARRGERLNVVFLGSSLTWGANATDPNQTSFRALLANKMESQYPRAHFKFWDASIGGTNSQLAVFRLERDVLRHQPDLVFVDFTFHDGHTGADEEKLAAYESLLRRIICDARCPAVALFFPGPRQVQSTTAESARQAAHHRIAAAYGAGIGDATALMRQRFRTDESLLARWWPLGRDTPHPGDEGYRQFAEAAWQGYWNAVVHNRQCLAPAVMLHADTYMHWRRHILSHLPQPAEGWFSGEPSRSAAWYDSLMSRWLDSVMIAGPRAAPWEMRFSGTMALLYGEMTPGSGKLRVLLDGAAPAAIPGGVLDLSSRAAGGNLKLAQVLGQGLDAEKVHTLKLIPECAAGQEIRLESLCLAGGEGLLAENS